MGKRLVNQNHLDMLIEAAVYFYLSILYDYMEIATWDDIEFRKELALENKTDIIATCPISRTLLPQYIVDISPGANKLLLKLLIEEMEVYGLEVEVTEHDIIIHDPDLREELCISKGM